MAHDPRRAHRGSGRPDPGGVTAPGTCEDPRTTVVVITKDRRVELLRTLRIMGDLPERPRIVVTDNDSGDGTAEAVARDFPDVLLLRPGRNLGAVGRNLAIRHVRTPYVAFCDDDTWWDPGSLRRAADLLDAHPQLAAVTARIVVEPSGEEDPVVAELRDSPLTGPDWLPGPALGSFLAAATVMRVDAFRAVGGFHAGLWIGGEEELLATDLLRRGHWLCYAPELTIHHAASPLRDSTARRVLGLRNTLWFTWLRRPWRSALRRTGHLLRTVPRDRASVRAFALAAAGLPWVLKQRDPVPADLEARLMALERARRHSPARRYVG
ncbi:glycosyltransferase family 2 protein [Streptomyces chromofuscus]|uniref:Glycosyltransferase n=1 Tax=Streptomyces chromofuscus TaxID=42881 RepID=A0A7M2T9F1_STRCW|nr:glycosyltransferase [Streptomyces chromofuscus]QOV45337.1 glycosyltransferase [Streptomyces chromofuscus]GGS98376.1 glycosyl transferase [Streptomyces chromofuscus]